MDRLIVPELGWEDYVGIAFDQISLAAAQSPAVIRRLHDAMEDLLTVTSGKRRQAIEIRLRNLRRIEAGEDIDMEAIERSHEPVEVR